MHLLILRDTMEAALDQSDCLLAIENATALLDELSLYIIWFCHYSRKPEQSDGLMDKLNKMIAIPQKNSEKCRESAEYLVESEDLMDLMNELDMLMEED